MPVCATAAPATAPFGLPNLLRSLFPEPMNVHESEGSYEVSTDLPAGVTPDDITVNVSRRIVTVRAAPAAFERSFRLPANADEDEVEAELEGSCLTVTALKKPVGVAAVVAAARARAAGVVIPITTAAAADTTAAATAAKAKASESARAAAAELAQAVRAGEVVVKTTADEVTFQFN